MLTRHRKSQILKSKPTLRLLDLPLEIIEAILSQVDCRWTLANLCRTSKFISLTATKLWYGTLILDDQDQVQHLLELNVFKKYSVHDLTIRVQYRPEIRIGLDLIETVLKNVQGVKRLCLYSIYDGFCYGNLDAQLLMRSELRLGLRYLHLEAVDFLEAGNKRLDLPNLATLSITDDGFYPRFCPEFDVPKLRALYLSPRGGKNNLYRVPLFNVLVPSLLRQHGEHLQLLEFKNKGALNHFSYLIENIAYCTGLRTLVIVDQEGTYPPRTRGLPFNFVANANRAFDTLVKNLRDGPVKKQDDHSESADQRLTPIVSNQLIYNHPLEQLVFLNDANYKSGMARLKLGLPRGTTTPNAKELYRDEGVNGSSTFWFPHLTLAVVP